MKVELFPSLSFFFGVGTHLRRSLVLNRIGLSWAAYILRCGSLILIREHDISFGQRSRHLGILIKTHAIREQLVRFPFLTGHSTFDIFTFGILM